jgi:hypothetical protein
MKFVFALSFLLGVASASLGLTLPTDWDCTNIPAPFVRPENVSATTLFTPELAVDPSWDLPTTEVPADHVLLHIAYPRYLFIQNISGGDPILMYENNGACYTDPAGKWNMDFGVDADNYFLRIRIAFAALKACGCEFSTTEVNHIYCVWWMTAIEPFILGGVENIQVQTVRWQVHILLPSRLQETFHSINVWPKAEYAAAILVFEEYPPPDYSVRVVFLIMVAKPYMADGAYLVAPDGMTGWANPPLPDDLNDLTPQTTVCDDMGTSFCYQQIVVDLVPTDPCGHLGWPWSRNTYNGTYELGGTTKCEASFPNCKLPSYQSWYDWVFVFEFDTNDFCPTYLNYNLAGKLQGNIRTYNTSALDMIETTFVAGATIWGKIWIDRLNGFPWIIKSIETPSLSIGVSVDGSAFDYYTLVPLDSRLDDALIHFSGVQQMNYSVTQPAIAYNYFSLIMSPFEDSFLLGITPPTLRHYIFKASLIAWYEWDTTDGRVELQSVESSAKTNAMYVGLGIPTVLNGPKPVIPPTTPSTGAVASATGSGALVAGIAVGSVALLGAIGAVLFVVRRRRGYATQTDTL